MKLFILSFFFVAAGLYHLLDPEFYLPMMPAYLPYHRALITLSGLAEILFGVLVLPRRTRMLARYGLVMLLVAIFPANIEMAMHPERFPAFSPTLLWLRLPLQFALIFWVLRATRTKRDWLGG